MSLSILVVDDEPALGEAMAELLRMQGHDVTAAASAHEALAFSTETAFDLVIADLMMPGPGGDALLATMRERCSHPCWFAMMSASPSHTVAQRIAGCDRFLAKPFELPALARLCEDCSADLAARASSCDKNAQRAG